VIEAVGQAAAVPGRRPPMQMAVQMLRPGGQITAMGQPEGEEPFAWRPLVLKEATVVTSRLNLGDLPAAAALMAGGRLHPADIITHTVSPGGVGRAFEMMHSQPESVIKVVVDMASWG
jgi:threonine dehydrogenase-like Zn-dependent dehydrogenase